MTKIAANIIITCPAYYITMCMDPSLVFVPLAQYSTHWLSDTIKSIDLQIRKRAWCCLLVLCRWRFHPKLAAISGRFPLPRASFLYPPLFRNWLTHHIFCRFIHSLFSFSTRESFSSSFKTVWLLLWNVALSRGTNPASASRWQLSRDFLITIVYAES